MKISIDAIAQSPQDQYLAKRHHVSRQLWLNEEEETASSMRGMLDGLKCFGGSHGMMSIIMWWISHKYHMSGCDGIAVSIKRSTTFSSCKKGSDDLWVFPVLPRRHCSPSINHHFFWDHRKSSISCSWHVFGSILFQASKSCKVAYATTGSKPESFTGKNIPGEHHLPKETLQVFLRK